MASAPTVAYDIITPIEASDAEPVVRDIGLGDLREALAKGIADFNAMPSHVAFIVLVYPAIGALLGATMLGFDVIPLFYPMIAGFALLGPFVALGLYELSRRREMGRDTSWQHMFDVVHSPSLPSILLIGLLLLVIFSLWIATADMIYLSVFEHRGVPSVQDFTDRILKTPEGRNVIYFGNLTGFCFAVLVYALTVVSFPLLLDRNIGAPAAMATSLRVVARNPVTMAVWAFIIAAGLFIGLATLMIGLVVVLPILGHASWHLYRAAVEPDDTPRLPYAPPRRRTRYGAQFPFSLFVASRKWEDE